MKCEQQVTRLTKSSTCGADHVSTLMHAHWCRGRFIDGEELARRLETEAAPRLTPRMFMHKIQRACSAQVWAFHVVLAIASSEH